MATPEHEYIPDHKLQYYREQLYRELSHLYRWEGLPETIPHDYLESTLVRSGQVLFYEHPVIGLDVMASTTTGYNRHNKPVQARVTINSTSNYEISETIERNVKSVTYSKNAVEEFNPTTDGVICYNMEKGQSFKDIVDHFAYRLALAQQAFDTNLLWQNRPYIFPVENNDMKLTYDKLFQDIVSGRPFLPIDKQLVYNREKGEMGIRLDVPFIGDKLMDTQNEIMMKFKQTIGFDTAGVDKMERTNVVEIESNAQHTKSVLQIGLEQREIAAENLSEFFGEDVAVSVMQPDVEEVEDEEVVIDGPGNDGTEEPPSE